MPRFRLSRPARTDILNILATSDERWGPQATRRYNAILNLALRKVAAEPRGLTTRDRSDLLPRLRSFHIRHMRGSPEARVARPVHVIYYREIGAGLIEIVGVLHERMEPSRHFGRFR